MKYIGLNVGLCVADILSGRIKKEDVVCIVLNQSYYTENDLINAYHFNFHDEGVVPEEGDEYVGVWYKYDEAIVRALIHDLWGSYGQTKMRIIDPREYDESNQNVVTPIGTAKGHWLNLQNQTFFK